MTTKYLEIDSTYRDRNTWPLPGEFQVLISPQNNVTPTNAVDPVSTATPLTEWKSNDFSVVGSSFITGTVINTGYGANNTPYTIIFSATNLQPVNDYYRHAVLTSAPNLSSRILTYKYLGNDEAEVTLETPLTISTGSLITITDSTDLNALRIFVPTSPIYPDNFYASCFLYDETVNDSSPINFFDSKTGTVTVNFAIPGWSVTDSFSIRKSIPIFTGTAGVGSTGSTVQLGVNSLNNLIGSFIRIYPSYPPVPPNGEIKRIIAYDPSTFTATVNPAFSSSTAGSRFEILPFSYDNNVPFVYTGTTQVEFVNSNVRLVNLILPSSLLAVGYGGKISTYPYVYVQLTPLNTVNNNITSSNNPNSTPTLFRAVRNHNEREDSVFFTNFHGDGMVQKVKFRVENDFYFKIILPNGQTFQTIESDTTSPSIPNPLIQINALFEIIRR